MAGRFDELRCFRKARFFSISLKRSSCGLHSKTNQLEIRKNCAENFLVCFLMKLEHLQKC